MTTYIVTDKNTQLNALDSGMEYYNLTTAQSVSGASNYMFQHSHLLDKDTIRSLVKKISEIDRYNVHDLIEEIDKVIARRVQYSIECFDKLEENDRLVITI